MKKIAGALIGVLMMLAVASSVNAAVLLQNVFPGTATGAVGDNNVNYAAQSVKSSSTLSNFKNLTLKLSCGSCTTLPDDLTVQIRNSTIPSGGGLPGSVVYASGVVPAASLGQGTDGLSEHRIQLDNTITLDADTEYWIYIFSTVPAVYSGPRVSYNLNLSGGYPNGLIKYYQNGEWKPWYEPYDMYFILESEDAPPPPPPAVPPSLRLPFRGGETWYVTQGNGDGNHIAVNGMQYAWDFNAVDDAGKSVLAPASGKVVETYDSCPDNGSYCNSGWGNVVIINYGNGKYGKLAHLRTVSVKKGQYVFQGEQVGTCGGTGDNYGPHIHYQTQGGPGFNDSSVSSSFVDPDVITKNPDGVPTGCNCNFDDGNHRYISSNSVPVAIYHLDTTFDTSGNSNNATANPSCLVAGCLNLNGTSNYLEAPDSPSLSITGVNLSMAGWLKTSSSSTQWIVSKYNNGASDASYGLYLSNGYVKFTVSPNGSTGGEVQSTVGVNDGNRRHVVVTYNGTDLTIYIDGAVNTWQSYFITNIFDSVSPLRIGAKNSQTAMEFFSEMLDEIVIYDRTLTADEVNNMYYSSKP